MGSTTTFFNASRQVTIGNGRNGLEGSSNLLRPAKPEGLLEIFLRSKLGLVLCSVISDEIETYRVYVEQSEKRTMGAGVEGQWKVSQLPEEKEEEEQTH